MNVVVELRPVGTFLRLGYLTHHTLDVMNVVGMENITKIFVSKCVKEHGVIFSVVLLI